ncbi:MAG: sigma-54-dependent Fis family transcriptional regulator [Deltaproteobacteria bacterium]|nr:sigma-54-dependent Fis family transcriptional regulator [Deltaproteobacteria bacterium]
MPTTKWGQAKSVLLLGAEGGALGGIADALGSVGFRVVRTPPGVDVLEVLAREHVAAAYVDGSSFSRALGLVGTIRAQHPEVAPVLVCPSAAVTDVADAMRAGAWDVLSAGIDIKVLLSRLHDAIDQPMRAAAVAPDALMGLAGLTGASPAIRQVFSVIQRVARFRTTVLVDGESGTGKELAARALHAAGPRKDRPFVPVNCATLTRELLENELFGHERGAFTGAHAQKRGLFELADGGTLFLDEVGEMDPATQAKLLRVIERSEFRRVGGTGKVKIDVNVVAATNRDLRVAIGAGRFREDLYYRLRVVTIHMPSLRERREDIPALAEAFIADFNLRHGERVRGVTADAMRRLMQYDWPGNVRELKNLMESAAMLAERDLLELRLFDEAIGGPTWQPSPPLDPVVGEPATIAPARVEVTLPARLEDVERRLILATLERAGTRKDAARQLGIGLRTLYAKLAAYGVEVPGDRP